MKTITLTDHKTALENAVSKMATAVSLLRETLESAKGIVSEFVRNPDRSNIKDALSSQAQAVHAESLLAAIGNLEARTASIEGDYIKANIESIAQLLRDMIQTRSRGRDIFRTRLGQAIGKLSESIALAVPHSPEIVALSAERDRLEGELHTADNRVTEANRAITRVTNRQSLESAVEVCERITFELAE